MITVLATQEDILSTQSSQHNNQTYSDSSDESSSALAQSQELLSELSIETQLSTINHALRVLNQSPIPTKKHKQTKWIDNKVKTVSTNLIKSLQPNKCSVTRHERLCFSQKF